jgi:hypothetical protein
MNRWLTVALALLALATCGMARAEGAVVVPHTRSVRLSGKQSEWARQGVLGVQFGKAAAIPAQAGTAAGALHEVAWLAPAGAPAARWRLARLPSAAPQVSAAADPATGQVELRQGAERVLRYNRKTVDPTPSLDRISEANRIYARPRSDYIDPLYGPSGEPMTRDLPIDHPHHRGIYWAWPETQYGAEMGDLHALQRVWARPAEPMALTSGPVYAEVRADSLWMWEDREPIVRETAVIRAYRSVEGARTVDLTFTFRALKEGVTIARRGTAAYGGLNQRMNEVQDQKITFHTDGQGASPRMAWGDLSGRFAGSAKAAGLTVFQVASNPCYPGDWVQYPELNWFQPTFPAANMRRPLSTEQPLTLRFRLWVHPGATPSDETLRTLWSAANQR